MSIETASRGLKSSTIKLAIRRKIDDWLETLPDSLKDVAKKNTIVTGGCITSMLLDEKVNDYDIYFKTKDATASIATHYCKRFENETKLDTTTIRKLTPIVKLDTRTNIKGEEEDRVLIWIQSAGVAAEKQEPYRFFESLSETDATSFVDSLDTTSDNFEGTSDASPESIERLADAIKPIKGLKYRPVYLSQNAVTLSDKIQLIVRFFGDPEQIHRNFDYVHATCWYDYSEDRLVLPQEALEAILSRALVYRGSLYPIASIFRIRKFIERGWRITAGQILKICWQISELDLNNRELLNEQLLGVDQAYMYQLISALRTVDGKVDATYVAKLIDEIFE